MRGRVRDPQRAGLPALRVLRSACQGTIMAAVDGAQTSYTGRSRQMAVMAELLLRGCNVAIPEVDVGTDLFAFHETREDVARIQVKTATARTYKRKNGYQAQFKVPTKQLERPDKPPLYYAFVVRRGGEWLDFLIVGRTELNDYWNSDLQFGSEDPDRNLILKVWFRPRKVMSGAVELTKHRHAWETLPPLRPLPDVAAVPAPPAPAGPPPT
jgi:hypothetical protein